MEPNKELPPVDNSPENLPNKEVAADNIASNPEISGNVLQPTSPLPKQDNAVVSPDPQLLNYQVNAPTGQPSNVAGLSDDALIADDADLIEKEWIDKAKNIVDQTKNDPHTQNKEMSKVKAQYVKKRYNKDIKVDSK